MITWRVDRLFNQRWGIREPKLQPILSHLHAALASRDSNEAISEDLFDMIGYDDVEMIVEILDKRSFVAAEVRCQLGGLLEERPVDVLTSWKQL